MSSDHLISRDSHGMPYNPRGHAIWLVCVISPFVSGIFVGLRIYTRAFLIKCFKLSDYVSILALVFCAIYSALLAQATYTGMGLHTWQFTGEMTTHYYYWIMVASEFYCLSLAGYKNALLILYIELFGVNKKFRYACYATIFVVNSYLLCNMITEVAGCSPTRKFYIMDLPGSCIEYTQSDIAYGAFNMLTDLAIAILPLPLVWKLQLPSKREKFGLAFVLTTGGIAFVVAMIRWAYGIVDLTDHDDYVAGLTFLWSVIEVNTGVMCGCTPALKPLLKIAKEKQQDVTSRIRSSIANTSINKGSIVSLFTKKSSRNDSKTETTQTYTRNDSIAGSSVMVENATVLGKQPPKLSFDQNAMGKELGGQYRWTDYNFPDREPDVASNSGFSSEQTAVDSIREEHHPNGDDIV